VDERVKKWIREFVKGDLWRRPLVGFCDADDVEVLRKVVSPNHIMPDDVLNSARSVIVYFIPFSRKVVRSNVDGYYSSKLWAYAYVRTNELIVKLNEYLARKLDCIGFKSAVLPPTHNFDDVRLISDWSHKHVAYLAGLGTFGVHSLIITEKGCCGRLGSLITQAEFECGEPLDEELCLHKRGVSCLKCVEKCKFKALTEYGLDKRRCYDVLLENDRYHSDLPLTDVCGKCCCGVPCDLQAPTGTKENMPGS